MASVVDRRKNGKYKSVGNRNRFIERYKKVIKHAVQNLGNKTGVKDLLDEKKEINIQIPETITEPHFEVDDSESESNRVLPGNQNLSKGSVIRRPSQRDKASNAGGTGEEDLEKHFSFALTKEEFLNLYLEDLRLPNLCKKGVGKIKRYKYFKAGYTKEGTPARLNIKKTFESALARKIATRAQGKKPIYLDDVDIRYDLFAPKAEPVFKAVVFCIMDVSGSMGGYEREQAKKFFLALLVFVQKSYPDVEIVWIRHTETADECSENEFFYGDKSGGTNVTSAYTLAAKLIAERYNPNTTNIYAAQVSDGDVFLESEPDLEGTFLALTKLVQHFAYFEVENEYKRDNFGEKKLSKVLGKYETTHNLSNVGIASKHYYVYTALRQLFAKEKNHEETV